MSEAPATRTMRLQRFLARAGMASRRGAENLMTAGRVTVNGEVVRELGSKVEPGRDVVAVDGIVCELGNEHACLLLNKPRGYLTTMRDQRGRACVASLVPTDRYPGLYPIGRLDADTTGLLLFTTDGDLGQALLHPSHHVWKHYVALVRGVPDGAALARLAAGVRLDDGPTRPARDVELIAVGRAASGRREAAVAQAGGAGASERATPVCGEGVPYGHAVVGLSIHEGRKHQVKRMLAAVGHEVVRLHRDQFGPISLTGVAVGCWRELDGGERAALDALRGAVASLSATVPSTTDGRRRR